MNIAGIKKIIDNAESIAKSDIELSTNNYFNYKGLLDHIQSTLSEKFLGDYELDSGAERRFFDITKRACRLASANIDIDTRDIYVYNRNPKDKYRAVVLRELLNQYLKEIRFDILLNKTDDLLPEFGSIIWKKREDTHDIELIPIYRLLISPSVSNIYNSHKIQSNYVIEKHFLTIEELQNMVKNGWNKKSVDEIISTLRKMFLVGKQITTICVYELHCEIPVDWTTDKNDDYSTDGEWKKYRIYAVCDEEIGNYGLYCNEEKEFPYLKLDYHTIPNRAVGQGIVETMFPLQETYNEKKNTKLESERLGIRAYTTNDRTLEGNSINDLEDGDILYSKSGITRIDTNTPDTGIYQYELSNIEALARQNTNSLEAVSGEQMKTNTPYKSMKLEVELASKWFNRIKQDYGIFIKEVLLDWVLPELIKKYKGKKGQEAIIDILSEDAITDLCEMEVNKVLNKKIAELQLEGNILSQEQIEIIRQELIQNNKPEQYQVAISDDIFNIDYSLDITITGENRVDLLEQKNNTLVALTQQLTAGRADEKIQKNINSLLNSIMDDYGVSGKETIRV